MGAYEEAIERQERQAAMEEEYPRLWKEIESLQADVKRLIRERDAITRLLVVESLVPGRGWYVEEDLPPKVKGRYPTFEAAVAAVRKAAGLDAEPSGEERD
jgi:5'-deoxynucleotidase YfbR-like HD superfamily hydrolase